MHHFYHALHKNPSENAKVRRIAEGGSNADMIMDLTTLSELGKKHTAELQAINFDLDLLDVARKKSKELGKLLGKVNSISFKSNPVLKTRNKAYTQLKEAVDEIRRVGQYVFWRDEEKLSFYASKYLRSMNAPRNKNETSVEDSNTNEKVPEE